MCRFSSGRIPYPSQTRKEQINGPHGMRPSPCTWSTQRTIAFPQEKGYAKKHLERRGEKFLPNKRFSSTTVDVDNFFLGSKPDCDEMEEQKEQAQTRQRQRDYDQQKIYITIIEHSGAKILQCEETMKGKGYKLAVITFEEARKCHDEVFSMDHSEFGTIDFRFGQAKESALNLEQKSLWRKRSRGNFFRICTKEEYSSKNMPYMVGIVTSEGQLEWEFMSILVAEGSRTKEEEFRRSDART